MSLQQLSGKRAQALRYTSHAQKNYIIAARIQTEMIQRCISQKLRLELKDNAKN